MASNTEVATPENQESQAVVMRLLETGKAIDIALPDSLPEQKEWALTRYDEHIKSGLQLGYALVVIKKQMEHGEFSAWLDANNVKRSSATNYMKVANFFSILQNKPLSLTSKSQRVAILENEQENPNLDPTVESEREIDEVLESIVKLPLRKQLVLASQPAEKIKEWWQSDLFKEIEKMSPTDIRALIRQELEIEKLKTQAAENTKLLQEKTHEVEVYKTLPENTVRIHEMQSQIVEDTQTMQGIFDRAHKTFNEIRHYQQEQEIDISGSVIPSLLHLLNFAKGETLSITNDMFARFDIDPNIPVDPPTEKQLSPEQQWLAKTATERQHALTQHYLEN